MQAPRYTVIGAGPVGTLMAIMLARRGRRVQLIERRADPRLNPPERGRSINLALAARGTLALAHAGVAERIAAAMMPMPGRMLHDEQANLSFLPYGRNERELIHALSREQLNRILIEAAAGCAGIELRFDTRCLDVDPAGAVTLRDERGGQQYREAFDVLLGADGAGSAVRTALQARGCVRSIEQPLAHDYKELAIPPRAVNGAAPGFVFDPRALHIWPRGGYMLIALPNTDRSFTATLFLAQHGGPGEPGFDRLQSEPELRSFFERQFPDAALAIPDLARQFAEHPQGHLGTLHCERWQIDGRVLLLGDAAHAIVPFHGQGLNCGFEDCRLLDELLLGASDPDPRARAALFERFERERRPDTEAIAAMALENYEEMRDTVRSLEFARRQALATQLEQAFPGRFIPRYSMVMFHPEIGYAEARRRGEAQQQVLDALLGAPGSAEPEALLRQAGL